MPTGPPGHRPSAFFARPLSRRAWRPHPRIPPGGRVARPVPGEPGRSACWRNACDRWNGGQGIPRDFCCLWPRAGAPGAPCGRAFSADDRHAAAAIGLRVTTDRRDRNFGALQASR
jgi:hypothetical protein